ncbi:MAG: Rossmann-like and DUF2520 domain-containing protein [Burkholderiales bacterium]
MKTLNIIGAGRVGRTLAALWREKHVFTVQDVLSGTPHGTRSAVVFIGAGRAASWLEDMRPAEVWMLTPPDDKIAHLCERLARSGLLRPGDIVFHCSGALASDELGTAAAAGAQVASVHPLKSFAEPRTAVCTFTGTRCVAEGARAALDVLQEAFERIGARVSEIGPQSKTLYHAASVMVCNYLTALLEAGVRTYGEAGLARETALAIMEPLVRETVDNVFRLGPARALTGPIARGDEAVVARHMAALTAWDARMAGIYKALGAVALALAREQGEVGAQALMRIESLLAGSEVSK